MEGNYRGRGRWYPGVIGRERANGTFDIHYDDGEKELGVDRDLIRLRDAPSSPSRSGGGRLEEGAKVEGNYRGRGRWYPGVIGRERANGTFDIHYDDGEKELGVDRDSDQAGGRDRARARQRHPLARPALEEVVWRRAPRWRATTAGVVVGTPA